MRYEAFNYIECSIPEGMTVAEYRRSRPRELPRRPRLYRWLAPRPILVTA